MALLYRMFTVIFKSGEKLPFIFDIALIENNSKILGPFLLMSIFFAMGKQGIR